MAQITPLNEAKRNEVELFRENESTEMTQGEIAEDNGADIDGNAGEVALGQSHEIATSNQSIDGNFSPNSGDVSSKAVEYVISREDRDPDRATRKTIIDSENSNFKAHHNPSAMQTTIDEPPAKKGVRASGEQIAQALYEDNTYSCQSRSATGATARVALSSSAPAAAGAIWGPHECRRGSGLANDFRYSRNMDCDTDIYSRFHQSNDEEDDDDFEEVNSDELERTPTLSYKDTTPVSSGEPDFSLSGETLDECKQPLLTSAHGEGDACSFATVPSLVPSTLSHHGNASTDESTILSIRPERTNSLGGASSASYDECRICGDDECTKQNPLIAPCACTGSISKVHVECLEKWILNRPGNRAAGDNLECEICHTRYSVSLQHRLKLDLKSLCTLSTLSHICEGFALLIAAACMLFSLLIALPVMRSSHPEQTMESTLVFVTIVTIPAIMIALRRLFIRWHRTTSIPRVQAISV